MRIAVITANFGGFDDRKPFAKQTVEHYHYYFTEHNADYPMDGLDNRLKAKFYKMIPHRVMPRFDVFIWVDGNIEIKSPTFVDDMIKALGDNDIAISKHQFRSSIYEEARFIIDHVPEHDYLKVRYNPESIAHELGKYGEGLEGLYWCGLFARRNTPEVMARFDKWWEENVFMSNFDQLNFVYCMQGLKFSLVDFGEYHDNETYRMYNHNKLA